MNVAEPRMERRSSSLPQLSYACYTEGPRHVITQQQQQQHQQQQQQRPKLEQASGQRHAYAGRFSLSKTQQGGKSNDELNHGPVVRLRNVSGVGRGGDHSSCYVLCDEVYQCLLPEMQNEWAVDYGTDEEEGSRSPVSYSEMCRQLSMSMDNRAEFHRHLQIIINTNSTARLKRSSEKTSSARLDSSSKRMFLVSRTNERFKWSDLLWLQLQATVAGRQMKPVSVQIRSTREHDIYLLAEREKQKIILDEIRNFHVDADTGCASASSSCHSSEQDLLKANLKVVRCLLDRYEDFVALYPNTYCMDRANKLSEVVKVRVQILYAWYNIIMDLYTRIREVLFFVDFRFT